MRYDFHNTRKAGRVVIYTEAINGTAFQSIHKCGGMPDDIAKSAFHREHNKEVLELMRQKLVNEKLITNGEGNGNC